MQQLDCGEWVLNAPYGNVLSSFVFYVTLLVKYHCHFVVSVVQDILDTDEI